MGATKILRTQIARVPSHSKFLRRKLRRLGRALTLTEACRRLAIAIIAAIILLAGIIITDALLELTLDTRRALLIAASVIIGLLLLRTFLVKGRSDEELALLAEQQNPDFDSRLISAVQFENEGREPNELIQSMVADTERVAKQTNLLTAVDLRRAARAILLLLPVAAIALITFFSYQKITPTLLKRAFLADIPIPRDTQILSTSGDLKIGIGDPVELSATAAGILPENATLRVKFASGRKLDYSLTKTQSSYTTKIEDTTESFTYQFRINDARSASASVRAFARPEITSLKATQTYPEYTGIEPTQHQPGDFYLFPGGKLNLQIETSKPLAEATLRLIGIEQEIPIQKNTVNFEIPTEGLSGFSIKIRDTDGLEPKDPTVYRVELRDEPPKVRFIHPKPNEQLATKTARSLMAFEATDRFGIASVSLNFRINEGDARSQELALPDPPDGKIPTSVKHQYEWDLKTIEPALQEGDQIEYWITARDRQEVPPGIGESEHLNLRIVSTDEKRKDLLSRASDYLGSVGASAEDQQRLNDELGELIKAKAKE